MFSVQPFSCTYTSTKSLCDFVRVAPVSVAVNCLLRAALFKCNSYIGMRVNYNPLSIPMNHTCFMYENCTRRWFFECRFFFFADFILDFCTYGVVVSIWCAFATSTVDDQYWPIKMENTQNEQLEWARQRHGIIAPKLSRENNSSRLCCSFVFNLDDFSGCM